MARWQITISGKGIRKASVEKLVKKLDAELHGASVCVIDATPPESRSDRFSEAMGQVSEAKSELESLKEELEEWHGNLPEAFQSGEKGDQLQTAMDELDEIIQELDNVDGRDVEFPGMY